jgi:cation:H+ antiporter
MSPLSIPETTNIDTLFNIGISMLLFIFIFTGKGRKLDRWEGILFVLIYIVYLITLLI